MDAEFYLGRATYLKSRLIDLKSRLKVVSFCKNGAALFFRVDTTSKFIVLRDILDVGSKLGSAYFVHV